MRDSTLQGTALRYAAGDLSPAEAEAFERLLADDQDARDALSEAVRLSAAALGQAAPAPDRSFRTRLRARLGLSYRGPLAWSAFGAAVVAAGALLAVSAADRAGPPPAASPFVANDAPVVASADAPASPEPAPNEPLPGTCGDERSVAEIWADLSGHEGVEKSHDEEMKWRQRVRDLSHPQHVSSAAKADTP
jgi:hypothetical protein